MLTETDSVAPGQQRFALPSRCRALGRARQAEDRQARQMHTGQALVLDK